MQRFYIDAETALQVVNELDFRTTLFTPPIRKDSAHVYGVAFNMRHIYAITRRTAPTRQLTFDQICQLVLVPEEARGHLLNSFAGY